MKYVPNTWDQLKIEDQNTKRNVSEVDPALLIEASC